ncbi:hypothetical protein [Burkholderia ubonensis]|uniref:hypothetical protein n=1 Tax=Burkholderia ubonensis TaxID=101571 RepID=UPI0012F893AF|nr:hypothetical protein [Burkholderia ubonensis]
MSEGISRDIRRVFCRGDRLLTLAETFGRSIGTSHSLRCGPVFRPRTDAAGAYERRAGALLTSLPRWPKTLSLEIEGWRFGIRDGVDQRCVVVRRIEYEKGEQKIGWAAHDLSARKTGCSKPSLSEAVFDALGPDRVRQIAGLRPDAPDPEPGDLRYVVNALRVTHEAKVEQLLRDLRNGLLPETNQPFPQHPGASDDTDDGISAPPCAPGCALPPASSGNWRALLRSENFWAAEREAYLWSEGEDAGTSKPKSWKRDLLLLWASLAPALRIAWASSNAWASSKDDYRDPCKLALPLLDRSSATREEIERAWLNSHAILQCSNAETRKLAKQYMQKYMPMFREDQVV